MTSMLEVLREYKHLAAKRKSEGSLAPPLQSRLDELEALVKAEAARRKPGGASAPMQNVGARSFPTRGASSAAPPRGPSSPALSRPPVSPAPVVSPSASSRPSAARSPHEAALGRSPHEAALGRSPHEAALGRSPHEAALGRSPHEAAPGRVPHENAPSRSRGASSASLSPPPRTRGTPTAGPRRDPPLRGTSTAAPHRDPPPHGTSTAARRRDLPRAGASSAAPLRDVSTWGAPDPADADSAATRDDPALTALSSAELSTAAVEAARGLRTALARRSSAAEARRDTPVSMPAVVADKPVEDAKDLVRRERQEPWAWASIAVLFSLGLVAGLGLGLADRGGLVTTATVLAVVGIASWGLLYPALMAWRELAARRSAAHLNEPDFKARTPVVEPVVAVVSALATVLWLMLGGFADEGLSRAAGYLVTLACWLAALGWAVAGLVRPFAAKYARERAFKQYLAGGSHALSKNNPKRSRRLLELALIEADSPERRQKVLSRLEEAYNIEADELRMRGRGERADELMRDFRRTASRPTLAATAKPISTAKQSTRTNTIPPANTGASELPPTWAPRLLSIGQIAIETGGAPTDHPQTRWVAEQLAARGRHREALEHLIEVRATVAPELARAAAQEYIQQGLLRSADAVFDALGEPQIPEFYKAVAVEWSRQEGAPPQPTLRLAKLLEGLGELQAAARISCQGVLSGLGPPEARRNLANLALELCQRLGQDPPAQVLEAVDRLVAAGDAFRRAGDDASARRCYQALAERLVDQPDQRELLVPVLNRMFKLDKFLDDRLMAPLVEDVLENQTTGAQATRVLSAYRARHREDHRVTLRLFELLTQQGQLEEALKLLHEMSTMTGSSPGTVLQHFETLQRRFPDDMRIELGRTRALIKAGQVQEAAQHLQAVVARITDEGTAKEAIQLIDSVFEWGHPDPELRNAAAQLLARTGDADGALLAFEQYVDDGGQDPDALAKAADILSERLVLPSGAPSHDVHLRLARFHLASGAPQNAVPYLEVARASIEHRVEADLLLARAEVAASNPRRAVQVLRDAIDGRHPRDTPELHYELARVYDVLGDRKKARQIDHALEQFAPDALRRYQEERPILEKRDTEWLPSLQSDGTDTSDGDTDVGGQFLSDDGHTAATYVEDSDSEVMTLEEALLPRYRLSKRLGAGGMGDVHLARDEVLGRPVAIKVLRRTLATDLFIAKFREEARIVAKLSHSGIVSVYDIGQKGDWSYIVMEYVRGPNLSALVNAAVPPARFDIVHYVAAVADAMAYAHEQGVIHRDLKPANILVGHDGKVKVTDFGIAHVLQGDGTDETAFSAAGLQVGTVNYMAPEQLQGKPIDGRTDIYLLGTTLYYTLCRRYPFMGEAVALRKLREEPVPLTRYVPELSEDLDTCIRHCIAREPDERFQKMEELALVLRMVPEAQP